MYESFIENETLREICMCMYLYDLIRKVKLIGIEVPLIVEIIKQNFNTNRLN